MKIWNDILKCFYNRVILLKVSYYQFGVLMSECICIHSYSCYSAEVPRISQSKSFKNAFQNLILAKIEKKTITLCIKKHTKNMLDLSLKVHITI